MVVCFLICFVIWACVLIFGIAITVGILGAVIEVVFGSVQGGLASASAWVAMTLPSWSQSGGFLSCR